MGTAEFWIGLIAGFALALVVVYAQFRASVAGYRVKQVIAATRKFLTDPLNTGSLRNKYRASLGVLIDGMKDMEGTGRKTTSHKWPTLIENPNEDRWTLFDKYVRSVLNDINTYSFLGTKWLPIPYTRQLYRLTRLCQAIETTVSTLDAAFEVPRVLTMENGEITPIEGFSDPRIVDVEEAYTELGKAWENWKRSCGYNLRS